ncbi:hypothetical protein FHS55_004234 [Angulomicrobium tetraedrale]|uniref:Chlorophyllide reductase n=1 Tax=Ancylobacter tetraedralis TaxID=217068 RepID=A0A839ZG99_9HYPH|nr:hypothetical protein [Ancylobacter tetraedralis]MBB3773592.1 hypothetical protein [Ancylobacter tetraedralis]
MNAIGTALLALSLGLALPAQANPSTLTGAISVAQVVDLIQRSPQDNAARNAAMAYLAGVGETTGLLVAEAGQRSSVSIACARPLGISSSAALAALSRADKGTWDKTAATPILVEDMLSRAGCG